MERKGRVGKIILGHLPVLESLDCSSLKKLEA
jgi:hypothetical protein